MSSLLDPLIGRIRAIPSSFWEDIAASAGCAKSLPRKLASGERTNPTVQTIQPLIDYFAAVDEGRKKLPARVLRALAEQVDSAPKPKKAA